MSDIYAFREPPKYRGVSQQELFDSAFDMPLSPMTTFFDQAKGGALESFGLGTAVRDFAIPDGAPTPGSMVQSALRLANPATAAYESTRLAVQAFREDSPTLTEEQYKSSAFHRDNIPWDAGMTEARARALADWDDAKKVREFYAEKRPFSSFVGNLAGQALDPINYVPVAGPMVKAAAVAKAGRIGGSIATGALDAAGNTALFGLATRDKRQSFGDDVSWQVMISEIATAALIGSAFGAIGGAIEGRRATRAASEAQSRLATLKTTQEARIALNEAIDGVVRGEDVKLSPNATEPLARVAREVEGLSRAYDEVRANPTGDPRDPLVHITPEDIEGTIVGRGSFKKVNEADVSSRAGWGLVKIIWRHGEGSGEPEGYRIAKEDITDLPNVVRGYEPSQVSADGSKREWRVQRDGRTVVYADALTPEGRHVVTAYVQQPGKPGAEAPLSAKRAPAAAGSSSDVFSAIRDTDRGLNPQRTDGQPQVPATGNIARRAEIDNSAPREDAPAIGLKQAVAQVAKAETYKATAEQYRVNPETGDFPELADIEHLRLEGRLTEADIAELDQAKAVLDDANAYGEALKSVTRCLL